MSGGPGGENGVIADQHAFEHLLPSRFVSFTYPNPTTTPHEQPHNDPNLLRIAVLDSPIIPAPSSSSSDYHLVAAMIVPVGREDDWIFSTEAGHLHLLLSSSCSRLILVGNPTSETDPEPKPYTRPEPDPDPDPLSIFQGGILPLLLALSPKSAFESCVPKIPFLVYEDDVARILPVERLVGPAVGEMLVEDVEIDGGELRRRLRFKRMPNLVQSQVRLVTNGTLAVKVFGPETGSLVQPYLGPMVAGLALLAPDLGPATKCLCVGVGAGALSMCLRYQFGFNVIGVEVDDVVLGAARRHFGLTDDELLNFVVGDGIELMGSRKEVFVKGFDVIMVDLDSGDASSGIYAPPLEFISRDVLLGAKLALHAKGVMVVNVLPPSASFYEGLVCSLREVFDEVCEIDVGNGENYVVIAAPSIVGFVGREKKGPFFEMLKKVGVDKFVDRIKKI